MNDDDDTEEEAQIVLQFRVDHEITVAERKVRDA